MALITAGGHLMKDNNKDLKFIQGKIIVGIDIAKVKHYITIIDGDGNKLKYGIPFTNDLEGFRYFEKLISEWPKDKLIIAMEPTGHYWHNLKYYLTYNDYTIVLVNPYHTKLSKEIRDNNRGTNDSKDSWLIAMLVREGKYSQILRLPEAYSGLRRITLFRNKICKSLVQSRIQLTALLDEYLPEWLSSFCDVTGLTSMTLLAEYGINGLRNLQNAKACVERINAVSRKRISSSKAQKVMLKMHNSIGSLDDLDCAEKELKFILEQIKLLQKEIALVEKEIEFEVNQTPECKSLMSFKGVGFVTAATLLGQTGPFKNYSHYAQIEKLAGLNLVSEQSGKYSGNKKISKRGRSILRLTLYQIALIAITRNAEFKALYRYKVRELKQNKMKALIAISAKVLRVLFGMVKGQFEYEGSRIKLPSTTTANA
jgi:transposase